MKRIEKAMREDSWSKTQIQRMKSMMSLCCRGVLITPILAEN